MQCSQPFFAAGPPSCLQFYPCLTQQAQNCPMYQTCPGQSYNGPFQNVIGEGEVSSYVLPDGTVQLFFRPITSMAPKCGHCMQNHGNFCENNNPNGAWFVRCVKNQCTGLPCQPPFQPIGNLNCNPNWMPLPSCSGLQRNQEIKFHNDRCTSTEDIAYFCRRLSPRCNTPELPSCSAIGVQVSSTKPSCAKAVCHAPCNCPRNCAGERPVIFEGFLGGCDSDMSVEECRRGQKRKKKNCDSDSAFSVCSACEKDEKRCKKRKHSVSSCSSCECLLTIWKEEKKRRERARKVCENEYKKQEQQRKKRELERKKEKQACEKEERRKREEAVKHCERRVKQEKRRRDEALKECERQEKQKKQRCEMALKERKKALKEYEELEKWRSKEALKKCKKYNSIVCIPNEDNTCSKSTCGGPSIQLKINEPFKSCAQNDTFTSDTCSLKCRLGSAISNLASSITTSLSSITCGTSDTTNYECPLLSEPLDQCPKRECSIFCDKGTKKCEAAKRKSEKEMVKLMKAQQKRSEKEFKRRELERKKREKEILRKIKRAQKEREQEQRRRECEKKIEEKNQQETELCCVKEKCEKGDDGILKCPAKLSDCFEGPSLTPRFQDPGKGDRMFKNRFDRSCPSNPSCKSNKYNALFDCIYSSKQTCSHDCPPTTIIEVSKDLCRNCGDKLSTRMEQGHNCMLDNPPDSQKDCGIFCKGPTMVNKQSATHTEQANSGIFSNIMKKLGIDVQCSSCDSKIRLEPSAMCCEQPGASLGLIITANSSPCPPDRDQPCNPL